MKREVDEQPIRVPGFRFGAAACGVKTTGVADLGLLVADRPAIAAAAFTRNRFHAAPVAVARERVKGGRLQAIIANSGNANACTGKQGLADAKRMCEVAARSLGIAPELVAPASTGIIGVPLPMRLVENGAGVAAASAEETGLWRFARAIMTSDAFPKVAHASLSLDRRRVTLAAIAKGAGMIAPDMATLLVFFVTDAVLDRRAARAIVRAVCEESFNGLSVDGDTSTNDSLFLLAGGHAENAVPALGSSALRALERVACELGTALARDVAADGEGATKLVTIEVTGAASAADARRVARTVGESVLVKTAFFGSDPNWGRIACAIGRSGARFDPHRVTIRIGDGVVFRRGEGQAAGRAAAQSAMRGNEFLVRIDLGGGSAKARLISGDLSHEYVQFNSAYST